jgi:uncharacterized membrane protein YdjX (TVP38/TMEM64 family)
VRTFWIVLSALCGATAVFFVIREDYEKMFIAAVLGAVAWFLSYRTRLSETLRAIDETDDEKDREDEDDEEA